MKSRKQVRTVMCVALAVSQCVALAACGKKASIAQVKPASTDSPVTLAGGTGPVPSLVEKSPSAKLKPAASSFATSIASIDFELESKKQVARLSFTHWMVTDAISTVGPIVAPLSQDYVGKGADMQLPVGLTGYSAQLACKTLDCALAHVTLQKLQGPIDGKAVIRIEQTVPNNFALEIDGTPTGLQAQVISALQSQGTITKELQIKQVKDGKGFFKIDCRIPRGAIVPGQPAGDDGRRVIVKGELGEHTQIKLIYIDTGGDLSAGMSEEYEGSAAYTEKDHTIRMSFKGSNRISSLSFGSFGNK